MPVEVPEREETKCTVVPSLALKEHHSRRHLNPSQRPRATPGWRWGRRWELCGGESGRWLEACSLFTCGLHRTLLLLAAIISLARHLVLDIFALQMASSCEALLAALKDCVLHSDCVLKQGNLPSACLRDHLSELPEECQSLRKAMFECKRGMVRGYSMAWISQC